MERSSVDQPADDRREPRPSSGSSRRWQKLRRRARLELARGAGELEHAWQRARGRYLRIGITGFSGAGKTTMIASLIHQLRYPDAYRQSRFQPILQGRLVGTDLLPLDDGTPMFPYAEAISRLGALPPQWPESTRGLSGVLLELRLRGRRKLRTVHVELRDYPGEWLLDLPLLSQPYRDWSQEVLAMLRRVPRADLFAPFLALVDGLDPRQTADPGVVARLTDAYRQGLLQSRAAGLTLIQPGRGLIGEWTGDWTPFVPLPGLAAWTPRPAQAADQPRNYADLFHHAYSQYVARQVEPFFRDHFARLDRQLILVDLLSLLRAGPEPLEDFRYALTRVLASFSYGPGSVLRRLLAPSIDRLVVAATKTDQIRQDQWENLRDLLAAVVRDANRRAAFEGAELWLDACSAVRAVYPTEDQGRTKLVGTLADGQSGILEHPPIPRDIPTAEQWRALTAWPPLALAPQPAPQLSAGAELANYRVDALLRELLGAL